MLEAYHHQTNTSSALDTLQTLEQLAPKATVPSPCKEELPLDKLTINNKKDKDVDTKFIVAKTVVKPEDDNNKNYENTNKNLPGACFWEMEGPVTQTPHLLQDLEAWIGGLLCLY